MSKTIARRAVVRGATWAVPAAAVAVAAPAFADSSDCKKTWTETSTLQVGAGDVTRTYLDENGNVVTTKPWTDCTDVAVDGWDQTSSTSAGQQNYPIFRVVVGTMTNYTNVQATLTIKSGNFTFQKLSTATSPALAATPCAYRTNQISPVPQPTLTTTEIDWSIGDMIAKSSAMFTVVGEANEVNTAGPFVVSLTVTADYKCSELYTGACPNVRPVNGSC